MQHVFVGNAKVHNNRVQTNRHKNFKPCHPHRRKLRVIEPHASRQSSNEQSNLRIKRDSVGGLLFVDLVEEYATSYVNQVVAKNEETQLTVYLLRDSVSHSFSIIKLSKI